jgi:Mg-chelatase subunit ChlD/uncharacterized membrane protein
MFSWSIGFDSPWYLLLVAILPVVWLVSFKGLAGLGRWRRPFVLLLRSVVIALIVLALAEIQVKRKSDRVAVIYVLDQSESVPLPKRRAMRQYVMQSVAEHRERDDLAGVVVFGRGAKVDHPPIDDDLLAVGESSVEWTDATNIAAALKLAQALFTDETAKRIVLVTDGNENIQDALQVAHGLAEDGVGIDVVPVALESRSEVAVEKISIPADLRKGQTFEPRVVINNYGDQQTTGTVKITQRSAKAEDLIGEFKVTLDPGKNVFGRNTYKIQRPDLFTFEAEFVADDPSQDRIRANNKATAYTHVRGEGHILLIEDADHPGEFSHLAQRLGEQNLEVTVVDSANLFQDPVELLKYDSVILANVPRTSGEDFAKITSFSDEQIRALVHNTEQMGCGLVMIGGTNSFGAGGWSNTELEKAMPVDFQIRNAEVRAVGALVLLMHASEMADGNYWQKVIAAEAIKALGPWDYCGLIHYSMKGDSWLWKQDGLGIVRVGEQRKGMLASLGKMAPGDMPFFDPAMKMGLNDFKALSESATANPSVRHMIVISDGDPPKPSAQTVQGFIDEGIKVTTVAVGAHGPAGHKTLADIAKATGGKYYKVTNPKALPKIYQREARRVTRPLIYEPEGGVRAKITGWHEMVDGLDASSIQPLSGYVLTTKKDSALVEQLMIADKPADGGVNSTILARWNYGLGSAIVFTSDAGARWTNAWTSTEFYDKFFGTMIRSSMRPITRDGRFNVATQTKDGKVEVVVTAMDEKGDFLNSLEMKGRVTSPDLESRTIQLRQVASGRYVGEFDAKHAGSYMLNVVPDEGFRLLKNGINVPYSSEFTDRETNVGLLKSLSSLVPDGGTEGKYIEGDMTQASLEELTTVNIFRRDLPPAVSRQSVWPSVLVIAVVIFFVDVFTRRVSLSFAWLVNIVKYLRSKFGKNSDTTEVDERIDRLRSRKAEVVRTIDDRRATARFELDAEESLDGDASAGANIEDLLEPEDTGSKSRSTPTASQLAPDLTDKEQSYTSRLFEAKKKAFDKDKPKGE